MQVVAKCLHFVKSYIKQNKKHKQTLESAQYRLEIIFKWYQDPVLWVQHAQYLNGTTKGPPGTF